MKKKQELQDGLLVEVFMRVLEVSTKGHHRSFTVNAHQDATAAESMKVWAYLERGFPTKKDVPVHEASCMIGDFGNFNPETNDECSKCTMFLPDLAKSCAYAKDACGQELWEAQLVEIEVLEIWGTEIKVTDYITGDEIMNCYMSDEGWMPRKTANGPNKVLRTLTFEANFMDKSDADREKLHWDDPPFEDPMGHPSQYI